MAISPPHVVTVREISIALVRERGHLLQAHYEEIALDKSVPLDPVWAHYEAAEKLDALVSLGLFVDGKLVGYSISAVLRHPHYANLFVVQNDVLFVAKEHRGGTGKRLIADTIAFGRRRLRALAEACGVDAPKFKMLWHAKNGSDLQAVLERQGYIVQDILYSKDI